MVKIIDAEYSGCPKIEVKIDPDILTKYKPFPMDKKDQKINDLLKLSSMAFEQMEDTLTYLYRVSNLVFADEEEEACYHLGRLTSELKAFIDYKKPNYLKDEDDEA